MTFNEDFQPWLDFKHRMATYVALANRTKDKKNNRQFDLTNTDYVIKKIKKQHILSLIIIVKERKTGREALWLQWDVEITNSDVKGATKIAIEHIESTILGQALSHYLKFCVEFDPMKTK